MASGEYRGKVDAVNNGSVRPWKRLCFSGVPDSAILEWTAPRATTRFAMPDQRSLSPEDLAVLVKRLDALIEEARALQRQIGERLVVSRRGDQPDRSGQPERRRRTRKSTQ